MKSGQTSLKTYDADTAQSVLRHLFYFVWGCAGGAVTAGHRVVADSSDRLFFSLALRICHDSVEVLPVGGYASGTDRKKKIKSIFQQTSLGKGTGQYEQ